MFRAVRRDDIKDRMKVESSKLRSNRVICNFWHFNIKIFLSLAIKLKYYFQKQKISYSGKKKMNPQLNSWLAHKIKTQHNKFSISEFKRIVCFLRASNHQFNLNIKDWVWVRNSKPLYKPFRIHPWQEQWPFWRVKKREFRKCAVFWRKNLATN